MSKILFTVPDDLLSDLDSYCTLNHYSRSEFLRYLIRDGIKSIERIDLPKKFVSGDWSKKTPAIVNPSDTAVIDSGMCQKCQFKNIPVQDTEWIDIDGTGYRMYLCHNCFFKLKQELKNSGGKLKEAE